MELRRLIQKLSEPANVSFVATLLSKLDTAALVPHGPQLVPPLIPTLAVAPEPVATLLSKLDTAALVPHEHDLFPPLMRLLTEPEGEDIMRKRKDTVLDAIVSILRKLPVAPHANSLADLLPRVYDLLPRVCTSHAHSPGGRYESGSG